MYMYTLTCTSSPTLTPNTPYSFLTLTCTPPISHSFRIHIYTYYRHTNTHIHIYTYYNNVYLKIFKWVGYVVVESIKVEARCAECDRKGERKRKSGSEREERVSELVGWRVREGREWEREKRQMEREIERGGRERNG